jgi:hypothetical protein
MKKLIAYFLSIALFMMPNFSSAQIINPTPPTTAGTGLSKSGAALSVIYGTSAGTSTQGNDIRLPSANGAAGLVLTSNGVGVAPSYQATGTGAVTSVFTQTGAVPNLSGDVTTSGSSVTTLNTVTVNKGGTGNTSLTAHGVIIGNGSSAVSVTTAGTAGQVLTSNGASADPTFQALPTTGVASGGTGATSLTAHAVLLGNGTSSIQSTGPGTTGQVLTSNGVGADPTFQSVAAPGLVLLQTQSASASATIDFTSSIDSTYSEYEFHIINAVPSTDGDNLRARTSANAGVSWDSGATDYSWTIAAINAASTLAVGSDNGRDYAQLNSTQGVSNVSSNSGYNGIIKLFNPSASNKCSFVVSGSYYQNTNAIQYPLFGNFQRLAASACNGVRFYFSSSSIASGTFKLYGVKK